MYSHRHGGVTFSDLNALCDRRRDLSVHVLAWDYSVIYAFEREPLPAIKFGWRGHRRVHFALDAEHPTGASHHQKVVVVDDSVVRGTTSREIVQMARESGARKVFFARLACINSWTRSSSRGTIPAGRMGTSSSVGGTSGTNVKLVIVASISSMTDSNDYHA